MNFRKVQKRRGIGNVITTLIILIASVVLGAGVIFFGGSMFQTNTQSESIKVSNVNSWVLNNGTEYATTAFVVQNTGSKAVTINSINLRGLSVPTADWWTSTGEDAALLQAPLPVKFAVDPNASPPIVPTGFNGPFVSGPLSLAQGEAAVVYMNGAGDMTTLDAGNTYSIQIQAGQATAVQQVQVITAAES